MTLWLTLSRYHHGIIKSSHQRCSVKKVFLEISWNSQENTCARASFLIKSCTCKFIKKETLAQVFSCEFCEISKNTFSYRTPLDDCFLCHTPHYSLVIIVGFEQVNYIIVFSLHFWIHDLFDFIHTKKISWAFVKDWIGNPDYYFDCIAISFCEVT